MVKQTMFEIAHELGKEDPNISKLNSLPLVTGYLLNCPKCGTTFVYHSDLKEVCPKCGEQIQPEETECKINYDALVKAYDQGYKDGIRDGREVSDKNNKKAIDKVYEKGLETSIPLFKDE